MEIGKKHLHINGITWHCLSIFYARENFAVLINAISNFCETNKNELKHWSMYFSREQGERINLVFISENQNSEKLVSIIEEYFERFLKEKPSENPNSIPYGNILWMDFPNNSFVWNVFYIPDFLLESPELREFAQTTSSLIANLYDEKNSFKVNVESISTFLMVKLKKKKNIPLPDVADPELAKALQSYWEYEEEDLLVEWMQYTDNIALPFIIGYHLGLSFRFENEFSKNPLGVKQDSDG